MVDGHQHPADTLGREGRRRPPDESRVVAATAVVGCDPSVVSPHLGRTDNAVDCHPVIPPEPDATDVHHFRAIRRRRNSGLEVTPAPSSATTSSPPASPGEQSGDSGTVTVRLEGFDPATGQLTYVKQHLVQPSGSQPYLDDDPADLTEHQAVLAPNAEIRFIYSSCQNGYGNPQSGGVVCTRADLAKAIGSNFVADIDVVHGSVTAVRQIYRA